MNCPYCNAFLSTHAARCPECRSLLPSQASMLARNPNRKKLSAQQRESILQTLHKDSEIPLVNCLLADAQIDRSIAKSKNYDSILDLTAALHETLTAAGIILSKADLRLLLAVMSAGRILRFPYAEETEICRLFRVVNLFFSGLETEIGMIPDGLSKSSRLFGDACAYEDPARVGESYYRDTPFLTNAYMAAATQAPLVQVIGAMHAERYVVTELLSAYAELPEAMTVIDKIRTSDMELLPRFWFLFEDGYYLPRNMWFAFTGNAMTQVTSRRGAFTYSPELNIRLSFTGTAPDTAIPEQDRRRFTYEDFSRLCRASREARYFPEDVFRRLDALDAFMKETLSLPLMDNILLRRMEVFSSVYLSAGGEEADALDSMLQIFLLPQIPNTDTVVFERAFTRIFAGMELPGCRKALAHEE